MWCVAARCSRANVRACFLFDGSCSTQVLFAGLILAFVYFLIITEIIHRTVAAMLGSFITLGVLSALNKRPPLSQIILWIDFETVMLLFGMMIIVGVLAETGAFEFAAVKAYVVMHTSHSNGDTAIHDDGAVG